MENRIKGFVYGFAVGDAMGNPYEGYRRSVLENSGVKIMKKGNVHKTEEGTFSDDTSLMLATMDSIGEIGRVDFQNLMECYSDWLFEGKYTSGGKTFGIRETIFNSINKFKNGMEAILCGDDFEDNSEGSAIIRIIPVVIYLYSKYGAEFYNDDEALYYLFGAIELTNKQDSNLIGIVYLCVLISNILQGNTLRESITNCSLFIIKEFSEEEIFYKFEKLINVNLLKKDKINSDNDIVQILECIVYGLLNKSNFDELVLFLVGLGGSTDIITSIGGGIGGLYYGFDKIPTEWINILKNKKIIDSISLKFNSVLFVNHNENQSNNAINLENI